LIDKVGINILFVVGDSFVQDSLTANLFRLIRHMRSQSHRKSGAGQKSGLSSSNFATEIKKHELSEKFPFLALPDDPNPIGYVIVRGVERGWNIYLSVFRA
jgi:hypothetical protein